MAAGMRKHFFFLTAGALLLFLTSCAESTSVKKEVAKPPEPATGQSALYKMYQMARTWAPDVQVLKAASMHLAEVDAKPGTAGGWEAVFVSATKGKSRGYTYAVVEQQPTLHKGTFAGPEAGFSGKSGLNSPFPIIAVKVDTDAAYETALKNGGADYDKKNPGKTITFLLEKIDKYPDPVWRVIWGESAGTSNFSVYVDASTGAFQEKLH
jgi:hypothetical protein